MLPLVRSEQAYPVLTAGDAGRGARERAEDPSLELAERAPTVRAWSGVAYVASESTSIFPSPKPDRVGTHSGTLPEPLLGRGCSPGALPPERPLGD